LGAVTSASSRDFADRGVNRVPRDRLPDNLTLGPLARAVSVGHAALADAVVLAVPVVCVPELAEVVDDWTGRIVGATGIKAFNTLGADHIRADPCPRPAGGSCSTPANSARRSGSGLV